MSGIACSSRTDSSELTPQSVATLEKQAQWLQSYNQYTFTIEGHADERGTREYNIALGARRAQTVRDYLVIARGFGAAHAHDLVRKGAPGCGVQRYFMLVAKPAVGDGAQRELLSKGIRGKGTAGAFGRRLCFGVLLIVMSMLADQRRWPRPACQAFENTGS